MQLLIELPPRAEQIAFNRKRWAEILEDRTLAGFPGRIESNAFGTVLMMPPASGDHSRLTRIVQRELENRVGGLALPECPVSTIDGVRAADVGWFSEERFELVRGQLAFEIAPEICVEILSPRNTEAEMRAKRKLYFEAGAEEVWLCQHDGVMSFFSKDGLLGESLVCPGFPGRV